jgi:hypothetical protein
MCSGVVPSLNRAVDPLVRAISRRDKPARGISSGLRQGSFF